MYVHDIESGIAVCDQEPAIIKQTVATGYVDGRNLLGPVVGDFCMQLAIEKAKDAGVGWVVATGIFCLSWYLGHLYLCRLYVSNHLNNTL